MADAISRWAYPDNGERDEVSVHGSLKACFEVAKAQAAASERIERNCLQVLVAKGTSKHKQVRFAKGTGKPRALDLFSGTGSVRVVLEELGYQVVTLDNVAKYGADIQVDILDWEYWRTPAYL